MKKLKQLLVLCITVFCIASCENSENTLDQEKTYIVASKKLDCQGVGPQKCFLVKKSESEDWQYFYSSISGFNFEEGFEYEIVVSETAIENPPQDASSIAYTLLKVVSKTNKTSENLPE